MKHEKYNVTGMTCSACSSHVEKTVSKLQGVNTVSVNLLTNSMQVSYEEERCNTEMIIAAVKKAGYGASLKVQDNQEKRQEIYSKKQDASQAGASKTGASLAGASQTRASLAGASLTDPSRAGASRIEERESGELARLVWSAVFMVLLMLLTMHHMFLGWLHIPVPELLIKVFHGNENALTFSFTQFLLTLPIIYLNRKYYQVGFQRLFRLSPNMDSLIAIGSGAALLYGCFAIYRIGYGLGHGDAELVKAYASQLYFESAGMILTLVTVGKYLEKRSKKKTGQAIEKLMDLSPETAILLKDGEEIEIPTMQLKKDDVFVVKPGSMIPVDAVVLEGASGVDESAITGESIPVEKQPGDRVISATMNKAGRLICRAEKVGEDTTLANIIRLVEEASASKAPIAKMADKIAGIFVPTVLLIALVTFVAHVTLGGDLEIAMQCAISVLVISCPCALGLATPVAIMVGTGAGAKQGILIKSGEALQKAGEIDTVVLDKTGTITEGKPVLTDIFGYMKTEEILQIAAAIEKPSEHPLAEAVIKAAGDAGLEIPDVTGFRAVFGKGVECVYEKAEYFSGNVKFLEEKGVVLTKEQNALLVELSEEGKTPLLFGVKETGKRSELFAVLAVADKIKNSSVKAIKKLKDMKIDVVMLTGDNQRTAGAVQKKLAIDRVIAEVLPDDKEKEIRRLQAEGRKVAMVGDGINDAPALMAADVGIAISAGTDIAIDSADIVLMKNKLTDVIDAILLSKAVIKNIRQNLFWAFFYNSICIPLAAGVFYPVFGLKLNPMIGATAMSFSSLFVVGNALRLRKFKSHAGNGTAETVECTEDKMETVVFTEQNKQTDEKRTSMKKTMIIEGMMCNHCTGRVQKVLEAVEGVESVLMSLEEKSAEVICADTVTDEALTAVVTDAGYEVIEVK
ncbi:MAG: heavy metal translocating P-type ATPase [Lachnospiraceae bacterium]|nr:heavy metal translocating P-type ATPase [Lachnospiraceae bacterium]